MPTDTSVKWIHSTMSGAPSLTGQAGSMIALLDACLANGFSLQTVDSIVIAGGVATVTRGAGHPFEAGSVALIAGATVSGGSINGEQKVLASPAPTATTYCFDATGISNQTAGGTATHKVAPLGWAKTYTGTNLAVYKPTDVTATGCLLRVDDTGTTVARILGYESMTDVNTGTGPFPTSTQQSGGLYWMKSQTANSTVRPWVVVGDGKIFYLIVNWYDTTYPLNWGIQGAFGDPINYKSPDAYGCLCFGSSANNSSAQPGINNELDSFGVSVSGWAFYPRGSSGLGGSVSMRHSFPAPSVGSVATGGGYRSGSTSSLQMIAFPNPTDGTMLVGPFYIVDPSSNSLRSLLPGFYSVPQAVGTSTFATKDSLTGVSGLTGKTLKAAVSGFGVSFFDITGPWR